MGKRSVVLGFYQELSTAHSVFAELKERKFSRFASIYHRSADRFEVNRGFPLSTTVVITISFFLLSALVFLNYFSLIDLSWIAQAFGACAIVALTAIYLFSRFSGIIDSNLIKSFKKRVMINEILIIAEVNYSDIREVLTVLRQVKSGHPVTFLLRPEMFEEGSIEIPSTPLTLEMLCQEASELAISLQQTTIHKERGRSLMKRLQKSSKMLKFLRHDIADAEFAEQTIPTSAEWLLDNMYVIEGVIEDVKVNLPKKYYKELPKIVNGPLAGFPRIYALATELIKNTVGGITREKITRFLESYQKT